MEKLNRLMLIVLLSFSTALLSDELYINVTNVKSKNQLQYPYKILKSMDFKMSYVEKDYGYAIYVGPYSSKKSLNEAYMQIKHDFKNARIIVHKSKTDTLNQNNDNSEIKNRNKIFKKDTGYLLGFGIGYANAPSTHSIINGTVNINEPDSSGSNYIVYGGYDFNNNLILLLNYMYLYAGDLEFNNYYASINYKFKKVLDIVPYFGVSLGYSSLTWNKSPILNASSTSGNNSSDIMYGTQVGFNYILFNHISLKIDYNCLFLKHSTNITINNSNNSTLKHDTLHSLIASLEYSF